MSQSTTDSTGLGQGKQPRVEKRTGRGKKLIERSQLVTFWIPVKDVQSIGRVLEYQNKGEDHSDYYRQAVKERLEVDVVGI